MEIKLELPVREGLLYRSHGEIATVKNKETPSPPHGLIELPIIFVSRYSSIVHVLHKFIP